MTKCRVAIQCSLYRFERRAVRGRSGLTQRAKQVILYTLIAVGGE